MLKGCVIMFNFTNAYICLSTKEVKKVKPEIIPTKVGHLITVKAEDIPQNAEYLDFFPDMPVGKAGDDGYFVTPFQYSDFICEYKGAKTWKNSITFALCLYTASKNVIKPLW